MPANPAEIDAQKAALLSQIAAQGSQGQAAFQAEQARRIEAQKAAVGQIVDRSKMTGQAGAAPAAFTKQLQGDQNALGSIYAQDAALSQTAFKNSIAQTSAANAGYMAAARSAVPIVNAQTAGIAAQIRAEQEQARADAAEAALERDLRREQMAFEREQMALDRKEREDALKENGGLTEDELLAHGDRIRGEALAGDPVAGAIVAQITDTYEDFDLAVAGSEDIINSVIATAQKELGTDKVWGAKDRQEVYRKLYEYYNPGKKAAKDTNELGNQYIKEGVDPRGRVPGYVPAGQQQPASKQAKPATAGVGGTVSRSVLDTAALVRGIADKKAKIRTDPNFSDGNTGSSPGGQSSRGYSPGGTSSAAVLGPAANNSSKRNSLRDLSDEDVLTFALAHPEVVVSLLGPKGSIGQPGGLDAVREFIKAQLAVG